MSIKLLVSDLKDRDRTIDLDESTFESGMALDATDSFHLCQSFKECSTNIRMGIEDALKRDKSISNIRDNGGKKVFLDMGLKEVFKQISSAMQANEPMVDLTSHSGPDVFHKKCLSLLP